MFTPPSPVGYVSARLEVLDFFGGGVSLRNKLEYLKSLLKASVTSVQVSRAKLYRCTQWYRGILTRLESSVTKEVAGSVKKRKRDE